MMSKKSFIPFLVVASMFIGCNSEKQASNAANPLLAASDTPFNVPPFEKSKDEQFRPAYDEALKQDSVEIDSIVNHSEASSFENTIVALEEAGSSLDNISRVFVYVNSANTK